MAKHNIKTRKVAILTASYTELFPEGEVTYGFGVYHATEDLLLSIGYAAATDALTVDVPAGTGFSIDHGISGSIQVKAAAADATISVYGT